jgi:hypothetical protein
MLVSKDVNATNITIDSGAYFAMVNYCVKLSHVTIIFEEFFESLKVN